MAIILEAVAANGTVQHVPLGEATTTVAAQPDLRYRLFNDAGGRVSPAALVKRVEGDLLVEGLPEGKVLSLEGFFTRCTPQNACSLSMDNIGGEAEETVTPATQPVAVLPEGGWLMYASGMTASSAAPPRESEFSFKPVLGVLGGLAIAGGAGGGGGGGSRGGGGGPPAEPVVTSGAFTNNPQPVFTGTASAGSTITMTLDVGNDGVADVTYRMPAASDGSWTIDTGSVAPSSGALPPIAEGQVIGYRVQATNAAGAGSPLTTGTVTLDTIPPKAPKITSALLTNDATPVIGGTIEEEPGSIVRIELDLDGDGTTDVTYTATVTSAGTWSVNLADAPASGTLPGGKLGDVSTTSLTVTALDLAGNSAPPVTAQLQVDTRIPDPPTIAPIAADNVIDASEAGSPITITGTLPVGQEDRSVTVTWGGATLTATVSGLSWSVTFGLAPEAPIPADGTETVIVSYTNVVGTRSVEGRQDVLIDRVAPNAPTVTLNPASDTGTQGDLITSDNTPTIRVAFGTDAVAGDTVTVFSGAIVVGTATVSASHTAAGFIDVTTTSLGADGSKTLTARLTDAAGNESNASAALVITIDTTPPSAPTVAPLITNDTTPAITGTAAAGDILTVTVNGVTYETGPALVRIGNAWTLTIPNALSQGTYDVVARLTDAAGNFAVDTSTNELVIDTTAPTQTVVVTAVTDDVAPVTGTVPSGGTTNDTTPTLNGTLSGALSAGESVQVLRNGTAIGTATVTGTTWSYADSGLANGATYAYTARVVDAAGNLGTTSASYSITVLTAAPTKTATITAVTDDVAPVTGTVPSGGTTNDTTPTLNGTLSGALGAGETLQVLRNGTAIGTATVAGTTWTYADSGLANGTTYAYTARVVDAAGNTGATGAAYTITVDTAAPAQTVAIVTVTDNAPPVTGTVPSGGFTDDTTPTLNGTLSGTLAANETLQVLRDGTVIGTASVTGTAWTYTDGGLANGATYAYTARVVDAAGNLGTTSASYSITVLTAAPTKTAAVTAVTDDVAPVTGTVLSGGTTNDAAPVVSGTLSAALGTGESVEVLRGGSVIGTATVTGTTWTYADSGLANGTTYAYTARVVDAAGNTGATGAAYTITVDTAAPAQTVAIVTVTDNTPPVTGTVPSGGFTDDTTPTLNGTLSGTLAANETLQVLRDGTVIGTASVTGTAWTYTDGGLANGATYAYTARVVDAAGNLGTASGAYTIAVDTAAPTQVVTVTAVTDNAPPVTGTVPSGGFTNDTTPTLNGTLSAALGTGETLQVLRNGTFIDTATVTGTTWSYTDSGLANGATYAYTARVVDAAGNLGTASGAYTITIDTIAPTVTITDILDNVGPDTGPVPNGGTTDDSSPTLALTFSEVFGPGTTVEIFRNGASVGSATQSGSTTATFTDALPSPATYTYTVTMTDAAGNAGTSSPYLVTYEI